MSESLHQLQWRGQAIGPWSITRIRDALQAGEIHSLYQIRVDAGWLPLRDHLESLDAAELESRAALLGSALRQKETESAEPMRLSGRRKMGFEGQVSKPDPFGKAPPVFIKASMAAARSAEDSEAVGAADVAPTCWLAVAAFVVSCASFVPYLNLVSWLPSLVLGHLALRQMERQPLLEGRGLALGAVIIGYSTLALAALTALLAPDLFCRIFPIGDA